MIGAVLEGKYSVEKRIGKGGFASVYRGFDQKLKRAVAIKVLDDLGLDDSFKERFLREAESMAKLQHPNIVTVFDTGEHDDVPFIVMELVTGPALIDLINNTQLTAVQVCHFAKEICEALAYAHANGIVHRDLSLRNIMVSEDTSRQQAKILDFGLAKLLAGDLQTTGKNMLGTPTYMAPEQVRGESVDGRVDVFALGVGLYRIVNGRFPFEAEHPAALMYLILNEAVPKFEAEVPPQLQEIILRCLEKDPRVRPNDCEALAGEFSQLKQSIDRADGESSVSFSSFGEYRDRHSKRNPYLNRVMIKHPSDFFGREREVRKIYSRLDAPRPQSVSVVGERRIGKSSLLNYIYHPKNRKRLMQNAENAIFVYLDFQRNVDFDVPKFIDFLFNMFTMESKSGTDYTTREKSLDELKEVIKDLNEQGKRIVVLMDEFETITGNERFDQRFFSFLRALANSYLVAYVTSSFDELQQMCHDQEISDSPFFNIFSNLPLRPFRRKEAIELIVGPSKFEGVPLENYADRIIDLAGLFPFYLQIACSAVFEYLIDNPDEEPDWKEIVEQFNTEAVPYYRSVWEKMEEPARDNLSRIAAGKPINKKYGFMNETLVRRGYLTESSGGAQICSSSFKDFVLQQGGGGKKGFLGGLFGR